jgi:putative ABC transport system permease protein
MIRDSLYLAVRYLRWSPWRSLVLIGGIATAVFLPVFTWRATDVLESELMRRATSSPILIGAKGNEFDLTMSSLYFRGQVADPITYGDLSDLTSVGYGAALPLYLAHSAGGAPIVGTDTSYFDARGLRPSSGRLPALLGEVVAGSGAAERFALEVGDTIRSDLANLYNLAGGYPILLSVVGLLEESGSPDDEAFFTDVKTTWTLDGLFHGHGEIAPEERLDPDDEGEEGNIEATAALFLFQRIDQSNRDSFHQHGDPDTAPLTSVLLMPRDQRAYDQALGDFALHERLQAVEPESVVRTVLGIVVRIGEAMRAFYGVVALSTLAFVTLVVALSLRLRRDEMTLMRRIGCSRYTIATVVGAELLLVAAAATVLATVLALGGVAWVQGRFGA